MSEKKNWFETGYEGAEREQSKGRLGYPPRSFWLKPGSEGELVLVDDSPFCFWKHSWKNSNGKHESGTCISKIHGQCAPCDRASKAEYVGHLTAVDCTGYIDSKGNDHKYEIIEYCPKQKVMNKLKSKKEKKGSLVGVLVNVARADANAANTGDDFDFIREVKMDELYKLVTYKGKKISDLIETANGTGADAANAREYLMHHFQVPATGPIPECIPVLNYASLHAPLEPADLARSIAGAEMYTSSGRVSAPRGAGTASVDEDVPF